MAARTVRWAGVGLTFEGATEFRQNMNDINNKLKTSQAKLDNVTNSFDKNTKNTETLTAEQAHLQNAIELTNQKKTELTQRIAEATNAFGENSSEVTALGRTLAETEAELTSYTLQLQHIILKQH